VSRERNIFIEKFWLRSNVEQEQEHAMRILQDAYDVFNRGDIRMP
jgi:hypothetical protein